MLELKSLNYVKVEIENDYTKMYSDLHTLTVAPPPYTHTHTNACTLTLCEHMTLILTINTQEAKAGRSL